MPKTITLPVPGQIRRHVLKNLKPSTIGERDLLEASRDGAEELEAKGMNSLNTIDLHLTNDAVGAALDIARGWLDSDNGNNVMAGKSMLKFELEFEPDDPREIRHAIKMSKSVAGNFKGEYSYDPKKYQRESAVVRADLDCMSWTTTGGSGRVRAETLGWFLDKMRGLKENPHPATARAATKFVATYTEPYEQTMRLINGYLGDDEPEDQAPEAEDMTADFMEAIHGRDGVEEPAKRLVVIACGGKKSDAPGKIPADERYIGNYFQACLMAAEVMDGPTMVISAKHGLIPLTEEIENYDVRMGGKGSVRLGTVRDQVEALGLEDAKVTVLGGEDYVKAARQIWPDAEAPLKGGIGQQLKQLAGIYQGEALEPEAEADGPSGWNSGQLRGVVNLPGRNRAIEPVIWFGGKASKKTPEPGTWTKVKIVYTGDGKYELVDLDTQEVALTCSLVSKIHWAYVEKSTVGTSAPIEPEAEKSAKSAVKARFYEVPENWRELAEEGNTPQARAYWQRRCEEYRRNGK